MTRQMTRMTLLAAALLLPLPSMAEVPKDQLRALVRMEMPYYVPGVDVDSLRRSQVAAIYSIMHSGRSDSDKRMHIRSVLGGQYSLRGLLFKKR